MRTRPPLTWLGALAGLTVQLVVLVGVTVYLAHQATLDSDDATNLGDAVFRDLFGPVVFGAMAVAAGLVALLLVTALSLSLRRGGARFAGLVACLVLQVPLVGYAVVLVDDDTPPGVVATLVGGALVLIAAVVPTTWRWCHLPRRPLASPAAVAG